MKTISFIVIGILMCSVAYAGELKRSMFDDIAGNPVYTYTDDGGHQSTIKQDMLPDISGNPVTRITDGSGHQTVIRQRMFDDISGNPVYDIQEQ